MPSDIGVVDLMISFPTRSHRPYDFLQPQLRDAASAAMAFPVEYIFKDVPDADEGADGVKTTLHEMDRFGIAIGLVGIGSEASERALREHPDRFVASREVDPNDIDRTVRAIRAAYDTWRLKAVTTFPDGCNPQVPISDRHYYPVYQTCVDLGIPIVLNAGIVGPRVPSACQDVAHFDQVCYDFPELRVVMRHGAEPWEALAVKLMLKWPSLYYMTSASAPKYSPKTVIDYANTRGADKVMYAGYYPMGLSLERIFSELADLELRDRVWPKFLRDNVCAVFKLDGWGPSEPG